MTSTVKTMPLSEVNVNALENLKTHADELNSTAMQLTDAWGSVMFVLDPPTISKTFETLGFSRDVSQEVYETVRSIYAVNKFGTTDSRVVTWHGTPASILLLRGISDLSSALSSVNDENIGIFLNENKALLEKLMEMQNETYGALLFSPQVASAVIGVFGAKVSADKIYRLAIQHGVLSTSDVEGRRGISSKFIRSMTHILAAKVA